MDARQILSLFAVPLFDKSINQQFFVCAFPCDSESDFLFSKLFSKPDQQGGAKGLYSQNAFPQQAHPEARNSAQEAKVQMCRHNSMQVVEWKLQ